MTAATAPTSATASERTPSVLVVLVVRDAAGWLRETLQALSSQTYERMGIVAVDDGSSDDSHELLVHALGAGRVVRHDAGLGSARAFDGAVRLPVAAEADFVLLLRDDVALDPEAIERLVEATQLEGVERVGVVGAKVVDWEHPRELRDVGRSADRFGHAYTPLQAGEIDQGQFDRVLDVLTVGTGVVLVAREVWQQVGLFDERLGDDSRRHRLRLEGAIRRMAGPDDTSRPRSAAHGDRQRRGSHREEPTLRGGPSGARVRAEELRLGVAPVGPTVGRCALLHPSALPHAVASLRGGLRPPVGDRLERGAPAEHPPPSPARPESATGEGSRAPTVPRVGRAPDPRWFQTAERILEEQRDLSEEEEASARLRLRHRTASLLSAHPVLVGSFFGAIAWVLIVRGLIGSTPLVGGVLPAFPSAPSGFTTELVSAFRTTGLGGTLAASPILGAFAGASWLSIGSTALAQKVLLAGSLVLAAVLCYRAAVRLTGRPGASVAAAAAYVSSALVLWAYSQGRIALLGVVVVLPPIVERLETGFSGSDPSDGRWRFVAGLAVTIAVGVAFDPGLVLAIALLLLIEVVTGKGRVRGLALSLAAIAGAAILLFSFVPTIAAGGGAALRSQVGTTDPWLLLRLSLGEAPGGWWAALFLPLAAVLGLALAAPPLRGLAIRAAIVAVAGMALSWLSVAGYLPGALADGPVYAAAAAIAEAILVAVGIASVASGLERESFGFRQIGTGALTVVLATGLIFQAIATATGTWGVGGEDRLPAAWFLVDSSVPGSFRILWLGADDGSPFPAPGGDPEGVVEVGGATVAYGITGRGGTSAFDLGRPVVGRGQDALEATLVELLSGSTSHAGALLAPFGVRFVVAGTGSLPDEARAALDRQVDLDHRPATDLVLFHNAVMLPPATVLEADAATEAIVASSDPSEIQRFRTVPGSPLAAVEGGWLGPSGGGNLAVLSTEFDGSWELEGSELPPEVSFGWATDFPVQGQATVRVIYGAQLPRTIESWLLAFLWMAALWITRKPVRR